MPKTVRGAACLAAALVLASCSSAAPSPATPVPGSITFTSTTYHYSLLLPPGWKTVQASGAWDGKGVGPSHEDPRADVFDGPVVTAWAAAGPSTKDLAGSVADIIAGNAAEHGDTCPATPDIQEPITIGGQPGTLIGWNCGILINVAVTVRGGVLYQFAQRDTAVHAATDPTDKAVFVTLVSTVKFPN